MNKEKLLSKIKEKKVTIADVANAIGMDKSTLYRKINNDVACGITIKEANRIVSFLELSKEEASSIFFAPDVA